MIEFTTQNFGKLPYAFDQTLVTHAVLGYRFTNGISLGATLNFNTGSPESGEYGSRTHLPSSDGHRGSGSPEKKSTGFPPTFAPTCG